MSIAPAVKALSTIAVLPNPCWCVAVVSPAACAVCFTISPRMYDSVKRLEPTLSPVDAGNTVAGINRAAAANAAILFRLGMAVPVQKRSSQAYAITGVEVWSRWWRFNDTEPLRFRRNQATVAMHVQSAPVWKGALDEQVEQNGTRWFVYAGARHR